MPTLTISPADEACQALVTRINSPTTGYSLVFQAQYTRLRIDPLEQLSLLRVDVVVDKESQPAKTLDDSDNSSHTIKVWVRSPLNPAIIDTGVGSLALLAQIFLQLNNWNSSDRRVQVWECDVEDQEEPLKSMLLQPQLFVATISLRVEVLR